MDRVTLVPSHLPSSAAGRGRGRPGMTVSGPRTGGARYWASAAAVVGLAMLAPHLPPGSPRPATDHPIHVPASLERVATEYWKARGVEPAAEPEVFETTDDLKFRGWASIGGRRIWLTREAVADIRGNGVPREQVCALYIHERGHTAGLTHDSSWAIMDPELGFVPSSCLDWAWPRTASRARVRSGFRRRE